MQDNYLDLCKTLIEEKLGWGPAQGWSAQDFDELSIRIQDATGQVISATTLKRIWGRVAYKSSPSRHSLDALALFLDYGSWRVFMSSNPIAGKEEQIQEQSYSTSSSSTNRYSVAAISLFMLALGAGLVFWLGLRNAGQNEEVTTDRVQFKTRPVTYDLPNTVVFEYDVSAVEADSFFIQQSWDRNLRKKVLPDQSVHTSTYFYPGYYSAKLIANDSVLVEQPVHVKTRAWKVLLEEEMQPVYLPDEAQLGGNKLAVSKEWLEAAGYPIDDGMHVLGYYLVQDFGPLRMDNFSMNVVVAHDKPEPLRPCQGGQVTIRGEDGMIRFPFDLPGCTGLMHVIAGDVHHSGEMNDLSSLGADYSNWQEVNLDVRDKEVSIQIGTNPPYILEYSHDMGKVVGVWFQFVGRGMLDDISLSDTEGQLIYSEAF